MSPHNNDTRYGLQGHSIVDTCDVSTEISPELINKQNTSTYTEYKTSSD